MAGYIEGMPPRLPPYVQRVTRRDGDRYRGWHVAGGKRLYGPARLTPEEAFEDAARARRAASPKRSARTLADGIELVERHCRLKRAAGTLKWYQQQFAVIKQRIPADADLEALGRLTLEDFIEHRLAQGVSPSTVRHNLRALGRVLNLALREGWVKTNAVRDIELPRVDESRMDWFTRAELTAILGKVTDEPDRDLLLLFAYTGLRRSEVFRLQVRDVALERGELWVHGKRRSRVVPIDADLVETLERMLARATGDELVPDAEGEVRRVFRRWQARLKEPRLHPHALRHTFATLLVQGGERMDVIQHLLGHRTLQMVLRYVHQHGAESRRAVGRLQILPRPAPESEQQSGA